jgi:hypothetical protein
LNPRLLDGFPVLRRISTVHIAAGKIDEYFSRLEFACPITQCGSIPGNKSPRGGVSRPCDHHNLVTGLVEMTSKQSADLSASPRQNDFHDDALGGGGSGSP